MSIFEEIELCLSESTHIYFVPTKNIQTEPSLILICGTPYDNIQKGFTQLRDSYTDYQLTTILELKNGKAELQIVDTYTADVLRIKKLSYLQNQLSDFVAATPSNWRFLMGVGKVLDKNYTSDIYTSLSDLIVFEAFKVISK